MSQKQATESKRKKDMQSHKRRRNVSKLKNQEKRQSNLITIDDNQTNFNHS
jgi:hypothetical protein